MTLEEYNNHLKIFKQSNDKRFEITDNIKCLNDNKSAHECDVHYIYHTAWAARRLNTNKPKIHYDISSYLYFSTLVSAFIPINFYDYRKVSFNLNNFSSGTENLLKLSFSSNSIESISCMHVIEHIGLGRYGDPINPKGDETAFNELKRVTSPGGKLYIVLPVGNMNKLQFNAHRIYTYDLIMSYFNGFILTNSALVCNKANQYVQNPGRDLFYKQFYGCGCFEFTKKVSSTTTPVR